MRHSFTSNKLVGLYNLHQTKESVLYIGLVLKSLKEGKFSKSI